MLNWLKWLPWYWGINLCINIKDKIQMLIFVHECIESISVVIALYYEFIYEKPNVREARRMSIGA